MRANTRATTAGAGGGDTAADKAYGHLSRQLNLRTIMPGDRLPAAAEIADEVGVSRPAVLQAFNRLQSEGRLTVRPGRAGVHANPFADSRAWRLGWLQAPDRKLDELVALIELLEPGLARRLAGRGVAAPVLDDARGANQRLLRATDLDTFLREENAFHVALSRGAGAKVLHGLAVVARDRLSFAYDVLELPDPSPRACVDEHDELLAAIADGRPAEASDLAARHVEPLLTALLDRYGPQHQTADVAARDRGLALDLTATAAAATA